MHKRFVLTIISAAAILAASCAPSVSRSGDYGKISVAVGGASVRGLETGWPGGTVPTFSSITVTVSGSDMSTVTTSSSGASGNLTIQIPAGTNRLVEVMAVPAPGGGAPYFALGYSGAATVDVGEGKTVNVPIRLTVSETKIVLPNVTTKIIHTADSISGSLNSESISVGSISITSHMPFDQYGRVYFYDGESMLYRYNTVLSTPETMWIPDIVSDSDIEYSPTNQRLYFFWNNDAYQLQYMDVTQTGEPSSIWVNKPSETMQYQNVVAVDDAGYVYVSYKEGSTYYVAKLSIGAESDGYAASTTTIPPVPYASIGLTVSGTTLTVQDLYVKDDVLYILAAQQNTGNSGMYDYIANAYSRGKVVAVSTSTLTKLWEAGWCNDAQYPTDANTQLYGPHRFVGIAPKKLYIADDGFYWNGVTEMNKPHWANISRVIELDLEAKAITATGLDGAVDFFEAYSANYIVY